ncbi:MAG: NAD(P)H-hydrate dehydratase [SAR324 cluster bacterium]|nr:NAD(P)H-hydrate dehydratase [SAR324 cluster bacterium]
MTAPSAPLLPLDLLPRLCTSREMRRWENKAIESLGKSGRLLMENAASAVKKHVIDLLRDVDGPGPVVVCCGAGNNGGDGYAVARLVHNHGLEVTVIRVGEPASADARANAEAWSGLGETIDFLRSRAQAAAALEGAGAVVDAIFGTGLNRPVTGEAAELIQLINSASSQLKVAVDLPSGVNSDTGGVTQDAVRCTHTVSFQAPKLGCYQYPGMGYTGRVLVEDIAIPVEWEGGDPATYLLNQVFAQALLPERPLDGHKGTFGHLLAICGSAGMGGSALLAGLAALKTGTGLVTVGVPRLLRDGFLKAAPELMTLSPEAGDTSKFEQAHAPFFLEAARSRSAVVLGCGLGQSPGTQALVKELTAGLDMPLLIDADGLNALDGTALTSRAWPTVITPHPGEFLRLSGLSKEDLSGDRVGHARRLAMEWGVVLVLKGAGSIIAAPSGEIFINSTGDAGLATAGTGDVLSGIVGGLLAQGITALEAALLGVFLHGLARDCSREEISGRYFSAQDLIEGLNAAFLNLGDS